ncbi:sel1 repeat family protein [Pseudoalteromonas sp. MMG010]|uniref:sel1 repeat family protein n=1 Tax=Pseudoalteromonas sp. MMG010 TaxID=2822685 RepID=UPI001B39FDD4|nr:sel1 repeat family protein [Pseudoalteromonas sp. MMG010]MBQ4834662.1 sel1 repeat family protein [Pseudoalteromonas sp. MMG010]
MTLKNSTGNDLDSQFENILSFVTQDTDAVAPSASSDSHSTCLKALYYLKEGQAPLAAKWMRLAAMAGNHKAQFYLGLFFIKGQGVPKSVFHGAAWLSLASSQEYAPAAAALNDLRKHLTTQRFLDAQQYAANLYEQIQNRQFSHLIPNA